MWIFPIFRSKNLMLRDPIFCCRKQNRWTWNSKLDSSYIFLSHLGIFSVCSHGPMKSCRECWVSILKFCCALFFGTYFLNSFHFFPHTYFMNGSSFTENEWAQISTRVQTSGRVWPWIYLVWYKIHLTNLSWNNIKGLFYQTSFSQLWYQPRMSCEQYISRSFLSLVW